MPDLSGFVPFNRPHTVGREFDYMRDAIARGHISGDGHYTAECRRLLEARHGSAAALLTTSCTHALEMSALLLDLAPGDEVIVPSFTFVSTANAFAMHGAVPVFVDIRPDTFNIDERLVEDAVTSRTRAIIVVHYGGVACAMEPIADIARRHGLTLIEDNAHGLGGTYRGQPLGTFGDYATLSFHETKNVQCGEGGALLVRAETDVGRAEIVREKGTNRSQFFRGEVDKYTWVDVGSSYVLSDLLAAFLLAQLDAIDELTARRRRVWTAYRDTLATWAAVLGACLPTVPEDCVHPAHVFPVLLPSLDARSRFIEHLAVRQVLSVFHYVPLHSSPAGRRANPAAAHCPVTDDVADRLVRLPLYAGMTDGELAQVIDAVQSFAG